jgi:hypothetical protein
VVAEGGGGLALAPLLFSAILFSRPLDLLSIFEDGVGGGAIGVSLYGLLGGYALSGRWRLVDVAVGEAGVGDVEGVPEVVHRADLAGIAGGELLQNQIDLAEDLPVAAGPGRVVVGVLGVVGERSVGVG